MEWFVKVPGALGAIVGIRTVGERLVVETESGVTIIVRVVEKEDAKAG